MERTFTSVTPACLALLPGRALHSAAPHTSQVCDAPVTFTAAMLTPTTSILFGVCLVCYNSDSSLEDAPSALLLFNM
jgi:hypothetical protein